jgi:hypothetical protein
MTRPSGYTCDHCGKDSEGETGWFVVGRGFDGKIVIAPIDQGSGMHACGRLCGIKLVERLLQGPAEPNDLDGNAMRVGRIGT